MRYHHPFLDKKPAVPENTVELEGNRLTHTTPFCTTEVYGWPDPKARQRNTVTRRWGPARPELDIEEMSLSVGPLVALCGRRPGEELGGVGCSGILHEDRARDVVTAFIGQIPPAIRDVVRGFPVGENLPGQTAAGQWEVLSLMAIGGTPALELATRLPALVLLVAGGLDGFTNARDLRRLLSAPAKEIVQAFGLPGSKSTVKLFGKLDVAGMGASAFVALRRAIQQQETLRLLQHVPLITAGVLDLILDPLVRQRIRGPLLEEVAEKGLDHPSSWVREALELAGLLEVPLDPISFSSLEELWRTHRKLGERLSRRKQHCLAVRLEEGRCVPVVARPRGRRQSRRRRAVPTTAPRRPSVPFPPPIEGTDVFTPLQSPIAVRAHAAKERNCCARLIPRIGDRFYLYAATGPDGERATLAIARGSKAKPWRIQEMLGTANKPCSRALRRMAEQWLRERQPPTTKVRVETVKRSASTVPAADLTLGV